MPWDTMDEENVRKIDSNAVLGLSGVANSLAYKVHEIEKHFHNSEQFFGKDGGDNYLNRDSITPWQITSGAGEAYGAELQISDGTEIEGGSATKKFDFHRLFITGVGEIDDTYKIQIWYGTGLFGAATLLTETLFRASSATFESVPIDIMSPRIACNNKIWLCCKCTSDAETIDFLIGVHTYDA